MQNGKSKLLLIILFLVFSVLGFIVISKAEKLFSANDAPQPVYQSINTHQTNLLFIHLDDLQKEQPQLISVWVLFSLSSDTNSLAFKSIYPSVSNENLTGNLISSFSLDLERLPSAEFLAQLEKLNFDWDGIVIMDQSTIASLGNVLVPEQYEITQSMMISNGKAPQTVIYEEQLFTEAICKGIANRQYGDFLRIFPWGEIIPNHLKSDLPFDKTIALIQKFTSAPNAPHCEVIGLQ
jgi:hypothetical protein